MKARKWMWMGLMTAGSWTAATQAQPPVPAGVPGGVPVAAPLAAPAEPGTLWSFLGISKGQLKACKYEKCATPCGQMINNMLLPMSAFSGGIIHPFCPLTPSPKDLADQGAVGAAAAIKAEEAQAKARRAAIRFLGTVDCTRFPDAEGALIKGLRGDTNECVRFEAALALGNGCCCTKKTMEALNIAAACADRDGMPREYSDRVRAAAVSALQNCLACYVDPNPPKIDKPIEGKPEELRTPDDKAVEPIKPPVPNPPAANPAQESAKAPRPVGMEYYAKINTVPRAMLVDEARRVVEKYNETATASTVLARENSMVSVINQSMNGEANPNTPTMVVENGISVPRADVVSPRPQNLWELVTKQAEPNVPTNTSRNEVVVKTTIEPPAVFAKADPMPAATPYRTESAAPVFVTRPDAAPKSSVKMEPSFVPSPSAKIDPSFAPMPSMDMKSLPSYTPALPMPSGETLVLRPKTTAELASQSRGPTIINAPMPSSPSAMPETFTARDTGKSNERHSLKPADAPKFIEVPKSIAKPAPMPESTASPLAQRAMVILMEPNAPAVREQITGSLTAADIKSHPDLVPVLVETARTGETDSNRRAAIQALVRGQANSPAVMSALEKLTDDPTATVRVEAAIGLARLRVAK